MFKKFILAAAIILGVAIILSPFTAANAQSADNMAYKPTMGLNLSVNLGAGISFCNTTMVNYPGGSITVPNNSTGYVYLDATNNCAVSFTTSPLVQTNIPIAYVVTSGGQFMALQDVRSKFWTPHGYPAVVYSKMLTGQTAAQSGTISYTPTQSGVYRILTQIVVTTPCTSGTISSNAYLYLTSTVNYGAGTSANCAAVGQAVGTAQGYSAAGVAIAVNVQFGSVVGSPVYTIDVTIERLQ